MEERLFPLVFKQPNKWQIITQVFTEEPLCKTHSTRCCRNKRNGVSLHKHTQKDTSEHKAEYENSKGAIFRQLSTLEIQAQ